MTPDKSGIWSAWHRFMREVFVFPVRVYQLTIGQLLPRACRFEPSCSRYMIEAIRVKGVWRGIPQGLWRLLRCNPWGGLGHDPVVREAQPTQHSALSTQDS